LTRVFFLCAFQDVLRASDIELDWMFKLSFAYDIVNVSHHQLTYGIWFYL